MPKLTFSQEFSFPKHSLARYHQAPGAFERLAPPWERIRIIERNFALEEDSHLVFRIYKGPFFLTWVARHHQVNPGHSFCDEQVRGPFRHWNHCHLFSAVKGRGSLLEDRIEMALPLWQSPVMGHKIKRDLARLFKFRHRRTQCDLERHHQFCTQPKRTILMIGERTSTIHQLAAFLSVGGYRVLALVRTQDNRGSRFMFQPFFGGPSCHPLEEIHTVVHSGKHFLQSVANEDDIQLPDLEFLTRALATQGRQIPLFLRLHGRNPNLNTYQEELSLRPGKSVPSDQEELINEAHDQLARFFQRRLDIYTGLVIHSSWDAMIQALLHLESFLFLQEGAVSPNFPWIAREDLLGSMLWLINNPQVEGSLALRAPKPATRSEFQQVLLKRNFLGYSFQRLFRVVPWGQIGHTANLVPQLADLPSLNPREFSFLANDLATALALEHGQFPNTNL